MAIAWIAAIVLGWKTTNKFLFHAIFGALVLLPSVFAFVFALIGRSRTRNPSAARKFANFVGTVGFTIIGTFGFIAYVIALYYRG